MSYRYVFVLADEFVRLRTALRVRGFRNRADSHSYRTVGRVTGTLLVRGAARRARRAGHALPGIRWPIPRLARLSHPTGRRGIFCRRLGHGNRSLDLGSLAAFMRR